MENGPKSKYKPDESKKEGISLAEFDYLLDTDPGIDDAVALAVLNHYAPKRLVGIYATYGNVPLSQTYANACTTAGLLGWEIPILPGASHPAEGGFSPACDIHGADGLAGLSKPHPLPPLSAEAAMEQACAWICAHPGLTYYAIGPLTNLAGLIRRYPEVTSKIGRAVIMGGGIGCGNVTSTAEFNIYCDPVSAQLVFSSLPDICLIPLNLTTQIAFSPSQIRDLTQGGTAFSKAMRRILAFNCEACKQDGQTGAVMHDATAALYPFFPGLYQATRCGIRVEVRQPGHIGETVVLEGGQNVALVTGGDTAAILTRIGDALRR